MADQASRGGQKKGSLRPEQPDEKRGTTTEGSGERSDQDKRHDQMTNPDDSRRQPTNEQR